MPPTVDRRLAQLIAYKRIVTGVLGLLAGAAVIALAVSHGGLSPLIVLALALFVGGGVWTLRDGIRLRRELAHRALR